MNKLCIILAAILTCNGGLLMAAEAGRTEAKAEVTKYKLSDTVTVELESSVVVALSRAGEERWGFHQFPDS